MPDPFGPGSAVVILGLISAIAWGSGDFGGGMLAKRAPLLGLVTGTQLVGVVLALAVSTARGEPFPHGVDLAWCLTAGVAGVLGICGLYRGLAVGRMAVVAPTTGILAAVVPVGVGFVTEGIPGPEVVAGIAVALAAVVLVTRAPGHGEDRASGIWWGLGAGVAFGAFNSSVGQLSGEAAFSPLVVIRLVQAAVLVVLIVVGRQAWRMDAPVIGRLLVVGALDLGGNAAFVLATQSGQLAIAAVLSSLYPVITVVLAIAVLHERLTRRHVAGIILTAVAIVLIGAGTATP